MPQAITVSLKDITKAIDKASKDLAAASKKTKDRATKQRLLKKVESLKALEARVVVLCKASALNQPTHFIVVPL
jgi:hypothetical protein